MKKQLLIAWRWLGTHWRGVASALAIAVLAIATLGLMLNTLVSGYSTIEAATLHRLEQFPEPWVRAVNAPYFVPAYMLGEAIGDKLAAARIISVIYGLLAVACFFFVIKLWFNVRFATVGSLLFITSSWLLHVTHLATPLVLLVIAPLAVLAGISWFWRTKTKTFTAFLAAVISLALAAYVPYMPWIIAIGFVFLATMARGHLRELKRWQLLIAAGIYFMLLLPIAVSLLQYPGQLKELLGFSLLVSGVHEYVTNLIWTMSQLFIVSEYMPALHLGQLPLLDVFSSAMVLLGMYYYARRIKQRRSIILFSTTGLLLILVPFTRLYQLSSTVLLSLVYVFIVTGVVELMNQWFAYFPRNPWARNIGVALMVIAIGLTSFYHLERYFIAWPQSPSTKAAYHITQAP